MLHLVPGTRSFRVDKTEAVLVFMVFMSYEGGRQTKSQGNKKNANYSHCYEGNMLMKESQWQEFGGRRPPGEMVTDFRSKLHPNIPLLTTLTRAGHDPPLSLVCTLSLIHFSVSVLATLSDNYTWTCPLFLLEHELRVA